MNDLDFIPIRGKEAAILNQVAQLGAMYCATDTGKMFLDVRDENTGEIIHKPIGGSGATILYANATLQELPNGQMQFEKSQLEEEDATVNEKDLVINKDGKFLKVDEVQDELIIASVIAVSGTGGGGGGGSGNVGGSARIDYIGSSTLTVRKDAPCLINYQLTAVDAAGDPVMSSGQATWAVSNVAKHTETVYPGTNSFDIGPYLDFGPQTVTLRISINTGGDADTIIRKSWNVTLTELKAEWNYDLTTKNTADTDTAINWISYGNGLDKTANIIVDQMYRYSKNIGSGSNTSDSFTIPGDILSHGVHEVELYLSTTLNGETLNTDSIKYQMLFIDDSNPIPVIAIGDVPGEMQQYDTVEIPVVVYDTAKVGMNVDVIYYENEIEVGRPNNIGNGTLFKWSYTPTTHGYRKLTIACGVTKVNIDMDVSEIDLGGTAEVEGYAFKFKASEFSDNTSLQAWNSNNVTLEFSENFDWVNGGLKSEVYDANGNTRSYVNVRAGDTMTIKYEPFANNVTSARGKCLKIIFKVTQCRDYDAEVIRCCTMSEGQLGRGFILGAQTAQFKSQNTRLNIPYCEDTYIEFEIDITENKDPFRYVTSWIDGVPSGIVSYTSDDNFTYNGNIIIGSMDANVQIYLIKVYEKHLTDNDHLSNFIMDAPNATEMMARFIRNDILDGRGEIDPKLLAKKNPNCRVHCYEIPRMTTSKDDKIGGCSYIQYHGSENAVVTAQNVTTRVQGTSSAAYGVAAYNIDADFKKGGFDYPDGSHSEGWAMDKNAIPVKYLTTKVNVASCENANNALNQEWYNRYQPYVSPNRQKNPKARDCMQFYPGVLFIKDNNKVTNGATAADNNVFRETSGYVNNPYFKVYAVCNTGNSKKNTEVFHDTSNPLECCIEVADNQQDIQKMIRCCGLDTYGDQNIYVDLDALFDADGKDISITYSITDKDGNFVEERTKTAYELWRKVNMSKAGFEFRYPDEFGDNDGDSFEELYPTEARQALIGWFRFVKWMADSNPAAATNEPFGTNEDGSPITKTITAKTFRGDTFSANLSGVTANEYAGTYTADTEQYRMGKMLMECEDYMVMDSVLFHYLFIERHLMIDNVAKNTFWSSGDATHWDLTKNYDNDTADGNDNQGKLSLTYGLEPGDTTSSGDSIFNGPGSVWLEFARRLSTQTKVCDHLHRELEKKGAWDAQQYIKEFDEWQAAIPERCWIEAYYRLYRRPLEEYGEKNYLSMLEGGKKTHQRRQFETYQSMYISSKYFGNECSNAKLIIRPKANSVAGYYFPISVYADCYVKASVGQGTDVNSINYNQKVRRNTTLNFVSPVDTVSNATMYLYPGSFYQEVGDETSQNNLSIYRAEQLAFGSASKLRKLVLGSMYLDEDGNETFMEVPELKGEAIGFTGNTLLEELYVVGYTEATTSLDLTQCPNLKIVDARKSGFTGCQLPNGAPITTVKLENPASLSAANLTSVTSFSIEDYSGIQSLKLNNIDTSEGVNSLIILKAIQESAPADGSFVYNLQQVIWNEDSPTAIVDNKLSYLEYLARKNAQDDGGNTISRPAALTGTLTIGAEAYNSNNSDEIYNRYCCDSEWYPNLDIIFEGENAYMPKITILDQSGNPYWVKRIANDNAGITNGFYASGPNGAFVPFTSSSDIENVYSFTGQYKIGETTYQADEDGFLVLNTAITEDIDVIPVFNIEKRKYMVTVKSHEGSVIKNEEFEYGTKVSEVVADVRPPQRDDSQLDFYYTYKFTGYKVGASDVITPFEGLDRMEVRSEVTLTCGYEPCHVYENPLDDSYFTVMGNGVITLKEGETLKGKITIPRFVDGVKVTGLYIGCFQHNYNNKDVSKVTHFFFEPIKFVSENDFIPNEEINILQQNCFLTSPSSPCYIELPPNITSVPDSSTTNHWANNSRITLVLFDSMTQIPARMFKGFPGKVKMRDDIVNLTNSGIKLPHVNYIGRDAFTSTSAFKDMTIEFNNQIEFGGSLDTSTSTNGGCSELIFGQSGGTAPNLRYSEVVTEEEKTAIQASTNKIWRANSITLAGSGVTDQSDSYKFLADNFVCSTLSTLN